jgi:hypothetical protein
MRYRTKLLLWIGGAFLVLQLIPVNRDNPPINPSDALEASDPLVQQIFETSCYDCHSNKTTWPLYSYVAPFSWTIASHVHNGRKALNFSIWNTYDEPRKAKINRAIYKRVIHSMPLESYVSFHENAKLTDQQIKLIQKWTNVTPEEIEKHRFE